MIPPLKVGDTIAITAPASKVQTEDLQYGINLLKSWGLKVVLGETLGHAYHNFSDTTANRLKEFQKFLDDDSIKAIIAARGGYGVSKYLDNIYFGNFKKSPKWIVGFSDITALLLDINRMGVAAVHGPMVKTFGFDENSAEYLRQILFGQKLDYHFNSRAGNRMGEAEGQAVGGNLALLTHSIGSKSDFSYDGKILFIEDVDEKMYSIDRMMLQLNRAGKLEKLAGLVVGDFTDIGENATPFGSTIEEIVAEHTQGTDYPIAFGFGFGHDKVNLPVVMGSPYQLSVTNGGVHLKMRGNERV